MTGTLQAAVIVGSITVGLAALFIAIGWARSAMIRSWRETTGIVVDGRTGSTVSQGLPDRHPTFRWHDQHGEQHQRTSMMYASLGPTPGTPVPVLYDPERPWRGVINSFVQTGRLLLVTGIVLAVLGLLASGILLAIAL